MKHTQNTQSGHIAIFLPSLAGGGAERMMVNLAGGFAGRDYKVDIVLARCEGPYLSIVPDGVRVVDLKALRVFTALPGLVKYLRRERPDAMLSAMSHANIVAVWAKKISQVDCRLAVSIRNTLSVSVAGSPKPQDSLIPFLSRVFYPHADAVTAVSRGVADDLAESTGLPRRRIHVIYNPVVSSELLQKAHQSVEHGWLSESTGSPVILAVGRLTEQKDYPTLIKAFARVRAQRPARLLILGQGPDLSALKTFVEDLGLEEDVEFAGFVDNPYAYMKRADLYVLSSRWEGLPGTLIEAMACGVPVVATDCPSGPSEILEDGKWGRLVPVGDEHALADAVLQTLDDPDPPDVEARAADFGLEQAVNEYLNVLLPER